eukprot:NODE_3137_length_936_cov_61.325093_g3116_i0.p1 GENE.NODE_3137_length_936_cov_61.325093_g3116_i0~~NODE_3137_length_936_cov_61.325093_g3116_i0.p1  ORF type:complete len:254 (-),score=44.97 NODE_3137_length_936_cov_61.325093_g3116_i0:173-871(-)
MASLFRELHAQYCQPFSLNRRTDGQEYCREILAKNLDVLLEKKGRERHLHGLITCVTGYEPADEEELINESAFSQYQFFEPFAHRIVSYEDKFDFLLLCVHHWVCMVREKSVDRFLRIIQEILQPAESPLKQVLDLAHQATPRLHKEKDHTEDELKEQLANFTDKDKKNWPDYKRELAQLEAEQAEADQQEKERKSLMKWERGCTDAPDVQEPAATEQLASEVAATATTSGT